MNFSQCYEVLDLEPGCSWEQLQTGYRRQVQKWHPDRYAQEPEQQSLAAQHMLSINEAFGILAQHYRQFGILPGGPLPVEAGAAEPDTIVTADIDARSAAMVSPAGGVPPDAWNFEVPAQPEQVFPVVQRKHDPLSAAPWIFLFAMFALGYLLLAHLAENGTTSDFAGTLHPLPAAPAPRAPAANTPVFSYGDTPGRVYEIQGIPTRTNGDLWFYGDSEVYFEHGVVASWQSTPEHPLRVPKDARPSPAKAGKPTAQP